MPPKKSKAPPVPKRTVEDILNEYTPVHASARERISALKAEIAAAEALKHATSVDLELVRERKVLAGARLDALQEVLLETENKARRSADALGEEAAELKEQARIKHIRAATLAAERDAAASAAAQSEQQSAAAVLRRRLAAFGALHPEEMRGSDITPQHIRALEADIARMSQQVADMLVHEYPGMCQAAAALEARERHDLFIQRMLAYSATDEERWNAPLQLTVIRPAGSSLRPTEHLVHSLLTTCGYALVQTIEVDPCGGALAAAQALHAAREAVRRPRTPVVAPLVIVEGFACVDQHTEGGKPTHPQCRVLFGSGSTAPAIPLDDLLRAVLLGAPLGYDQAAVLCELAPPPTDGSSRDGGHSSASAFGIFATRSAYLQQHDARSAVFCRYLRVPRAASAVLEAAGSSADQGPRHALYGGKTATHYVGVLSSMLRFLIEGSATSTAALNSQGIAAALRRALRKQPRSIYAEMAILLEADEQLSVVPTILAVPGPLLRTASRQPQRLLLPAGVGTALFVPEADAHLRCLPWLCAARAEANKAVAERGLNGRHANSAGVRRPSQSTQRSASRPGAPAAAAEVRLQRLFAPAATASDLEEHLRADLTFREGRLHAIPATPYDTDGAVSGAPPHHTQRDDTSILWASRRGAAEREGALGSLAARGIIAARGARPMALAVTHVAATDPHTGAMQLLLLRRDGDAVTSHGPGRRVVPFSDTPGIMDAVRAAAVMAGGTAHCTMVDDEHAGADGGPPPVRPTPLQALWDGGILVDFSPPADKATCDAARIIEDFFARLLALTRLPPPPQDFAGAGSVSATTKAVVHIACAPPLVLLRDVVIETHDSLTEVLLMDVLAGYVAGYCPVADTTSGSGRSGGHRSSAILTHHHYVPAQHSGSAQGAGGSGPVSVTKKPPLSATHHLGSAGSPRGASAGGARGRLTRPSSALDSLNQSQGEQSRHSADDDEVTAIIRSADVTAKRYDEADDYETDEDAPEKVAVIAPVPHPSPRSQQQATA